LFKRGKIYQNKRYKEDVMKKKVFVIIVSLILAFSIGACKKKEPEKPVPQVPMQPVPQSPMQPPPQMPMQPAPQMPMQPAPQSPMQKPMTMGETKVVVPGSVKGKWSAVKLVVEDKVKKESKEYTVNLNSDLKIPDSNLKIQVGEFLPDFKMQGLTLTSASNEPKNPAVAIRVTEGNKQIFPAQGKKWGWLFSRMPSIHPLTHPKYAIHLKEGLPKKT
jgi:type IV secretory pathway VirB10-like protein